MQTVRQLLLCQTSTCSDDPLGQMGVQNPGGYLGMEEPSHRQYRQPVYTTEHAYGAMHGYQYTSSGPSPQSECHSLQAFVMPKTVSSSTCITISCLAG